MNVFRTQAGLVALAALLLICSCASIKAALDRGTPQDKFSRTYSVNFMSFHPKLNAALQDYAKKRKGNSFQIMRLGSDAVVIQGLYKGEGDGHRFSTIITVKPAGPHKTWMEIKMSSKDPESSSESPEIAAKELFRIAEKGTGVRRPEYK